MWFTIAFFAVPIAVVILIIGLLHLRKGGKLLILVAIILFVLPLLAIYFDTKNLSKIEEKCAGTYYFERDTLILNKGTTFDYKSPSGTKNGQWELVDADILTINLKVENRTFLDLEVDWRNNNITLKTDPYHIEHEQRKSYTKK